ncbi:hypothetical protein IKA15_02860, partial [bacterium]|nr:hypothetical protein [bacterium]
MDTNKMKTVWKKLAPYFAVTFITYFFLVLIAGINGINFNIPIDFNWDSTMLFAQIKTFFAGEWGIFDTVKVGSLSAPVGVNLGAFPGSDVNLILIILKIFALFKINFIASVNAYFFLTFFLTSIISLYVLKKLGTPNNIAVCASVLYSFLPYHFLREVKHLVIASYFLIPLMVLALFYIWQKKPLYFKKIEGKWKLDLFNKKAVFVYVLLVFVALSSIYYNLFFMFFLLIAGLSAYFCHKNYRHFLSSVMTVVILLFLTFLNFLPNIIYMKNNPSENYTQRSHAQTEYYGLKVPHMLLPIDNHNIKPLAEMKAKYNQTSLYVNESSMASLGFVLSISFVVLLFNFLFVRKTRFDSFQKLGFLTLSSVLLTVSGGFLSYFAFFGLSQLRSCNRISIFIAFFALIALCLVLKKIYKKYNTRLTTLLISLLFIVAIFDQTSFAYNYAYKQKQIKNEVSSLISLAAHIESQSAGEIKVFTLPYLDFPEGRPSYAMYDYELAKPSVYTNRVKYSYGAIKGSFLDKKYKAYSELDSKTLVSVLRMEGFNGILIDVKGYQKYPVDLIKLTDILGVPYVT